jgi:hypothetical protein
MYSDLGECSHPCEGTLRKEWAQTASCSLIKCNGFVSFTNIADAPTPKESADPVHYKHDKWEAIEVIRDVLRDVKHDDPYASYCHGQVLRYMLRLGRKDGAKVEAEKAKVYLTWMLENMK